MSNLFPPSIVFLPKLCVYLGDPEFLGHLVVTVSRTSTGKFLLDEKARAKKSNI